MPKKKHFDFKKVLLIGSVPTVLGAVGFMAVNLATYINLPPRVLAVEKDTSDIKQLLFKQEVYNQAVQDILKQNNQEEVVYSPDGRFVWSQEENKWISRKEYEAR